MVMTKRDIVRLAIGGIVLSILVSSCGYSAFVGGASGVPYRTDGTPIPLTSATLLGKSAQAIGERAQQDALQGGDVRTGAPQVALTRFVKRQDLPALGLSCLVDWGTIEEPPYALVILKGDLQANLPGMRSGPPLAVPYIAFVYDLWAGQVISVDATSGPRPL